MTAAKENTTSVQNSLDRMKVSPEAFTIRNPIQSESHNKSVTSYVRHSIGRGRAKVADKHSLRVLAL